MITNGQIALFCSRELDKSPRDDFIDAKGEINVQAGMESTSGRMRFGGGFLWNITGNIIIVNAYWRTTAVPLDFRLHLFGTTEQQTIGCVVLECAAPQQVNSVFANKLCREPIVFKMESFIEYDTNVDIKAFKPKDTLTIGVDI